MTTLLNRPAASQPKHKKALIERLNLFTALALGAI